MKEALEEARADSARLQEEMTRRLKVSEKEKNILQRSLDTEKKELLLAVASAESLKHAINEAAAAAEKDAQKAASGEATSGWSAGHCKASYFEIQLP